MPTLSTENRKAMSREIILIRKELEYLPAQSDDVSAEHARALENDNLAKAFFDEQNDIANAYYDERRSMTGADSGRIVEQDFTDSKQFNIDSMFFPSLVGPPEDIWKFLNPKITDEVNGQNGSTYLPNETYAIAGAQGAYDLLVNGFNDGSGTSTLAAPYTPGAGTLSLTAASTFQNGNRVIATSILGGGDGIFEITAGGGTSTLTVSEIISPLTAIAAGSTVSANFSGFNNSERMSGSSLSYPTILSALEDDLDSAVADWETTLAAQETALNANGEARETQQEQIAVEKTDVDNAQSVIDGWQALPATGSNGRFTDTSLALITAELSARETQISTRSGEISAALGIVTDNGNGTYSGNSGDIHYERYQWIEARLHRAHGTAIDEVGLSQTSNVLQSRISGLSDRFNEYSTYMAAQAFENDGDGSKELALEDASEFSIGDTIYLLDDVTVEVERQITSKAGNTLVVNDTISALLLMKNNARIYKLT